MSEANDSDNHLLVPINIEALVVGKKHGRWTDLSPKFSKLYEGGFLGSQVAPALFNDQDELHPAGVHLHWALPDALTHGRQVQKEDEDELRDPPEFPLIPNRWLVQRISREFQAREISVRAWIVESDYLHSTDGESPQDAVTVPKLEAVPLFDYVGKSFDYPKWQEGPDSAYKIKLTALGYGDPAFAAYYPACRNVLGFHDALSDVRENTALSYMVVGWYSDPREDPLYDQNIPRAAASWLNRLGELKWSAAPPYPLSRADTASDGFTISGYGDLSRQFPIGNSFEVLGGTPNDGTYSVVRTSYTATEFTIFVKAVKSEIAAGVIAPPSVVYPNRILCHGLIYNIQWKDKNATYEPQAPFLDDKNCRIAIGNTSAEALAALLAQELDKPGVEELLAAFQSEMLSKNEDPQELNSLLHQHRFGSFAGGRLFAIQQETAADDQSHEVTDITLPEGLQNLLLELNDLEGRCANQKRELDGYRWELYATWYKQARAFLPERKSELRNQFEDQIDALISLIAAKEKALETVVKQRDGQRQAIELSVQQQFSKLEFVTSPAPPYWQANDPVLLVSAAGIAPSRRHGHDGRYSEKDVLHCRITGQEISPVIVDIPNGPTGIRVRAPDLFMFPHVPFEGGGTVPRGIKDALLQECILLDSANADLIAEQAYIKADLESRPGKADLIKNIKALQRPDPSVQEVRFVRFDGILPSPITLCDWEKNPWLPLFLEWRLSWYSSFSSLQKPLEKWAFSEDIDDFVWNKTYSPDAENGNVYEGYTILTPHAIRKFQESLKDYSREKQDQTLQQIITQLGEMSILSQFLGGLKEAFMMRDLVLQIPPINLALLEDQNAKILDPILTSIKHMNFVSPDPDKPYYPIRAGHMKLVKISVVDAFGRTLELPEESVKNPIRAASLIIEDEPYKRLVQFPPRFAQPLRLSFDWIPASNPPQTFPLNSPICGWVMPNHLDKSLLFYDSRGTALGALQKILRLSAAGGTGGTPAKEEKAFFWVPQPGTSLNPEDIFNPELRKFVLFLRAMDADKGNAFWDLLDEALAKMDSGVPEEDPLFSVLVGRPLALVRISLKLELEGLPAYDQAMDKVAQFATGGFNRVKFPLLLGEAKKDNDGLVGFFKDHSRVDQTGPFFAAAGAENPNGEKLVEIEYGHTLELDCENPLTLTLLTDPRARVHARTGILPKTFFELASRVQSAAKTAKEVFFQVAPIISAGGDLRMPKPSDDFGKWSWACRPQVTIWKEFDQINPAGDRAGFAPTRQEISEGWLKLKLNPVAILNFWVKEGMLQVPPNANITLAWTLRGGRCLKLFSAEEGKEPVKLWEQQAPFGEDFRVQVKAATTYTLLLSDEEDHRSEKKLTVTLQEE